MPTSWKTSRSDKTSLKTGFWGKSIKTPAGRLKKHKQLGLEWAKRHRSCLVQSFQESYAERGELRKDAAYWKEQYRKDVTY